MGQTYQEWAERHERRGQAKTVLRLTSLRFGREVARQLEGMVPLMSVEHLTEVGDAVVTSDTADELLEVARAGGTGEG